MKTTRYCFACDLKNDPVLIEKYKEYHENVWPEIKESIHAAGIEAMEIYLTGNRLFMVMEVNENYDAQKKAALDAENPKVQEWEKLMWKFQQQIPWAKEGEKWVPLKQLFKLKSIN